MIHLQIILQFKGPRKSTQVSRPGEGGKQKAMSELKAIASGGSGVEPAGDEEEYAVFLDKLNKFPMGFGLTLEGAAADIKDNNVWSKIYTLKMEHELEIEQPVKSGVLRAINFDKKSTSDAALLHFFYWCKHGLSC
ncbi:unnamed protein product [Cuscuta epithymum]|uniref:Uncharacterized protein n=1 Tax=Cuscuta epithymum TaxID=186058 RepID=A0AAV0CU29_9ASTE|nr:unnamed protein product [Cuscuta epithymum]